MRLFIFLSSVALIAVIFVATACNFIAWYSALGVK